MEGPAVLLSAMPFPPRQARRGSRRCPACDAAGAPTIPSRSAGRLSSAQNEVLGTHPNKIPVPPGTSRDLAPPTIDQLHNSVQHHAHPEIHDQPQIQPARTVLSRRRQMRHQHKEVQKIAGNHRNRLFEKSSTHVLILNLQLNRSMPETSRQPLAVSLQSRMAPLAVAKADS